MKNPVPMRIKNARKSAKLTQKNLGIEIGLKEMSASGRMNNYEQGIRSPDIETLDKIAKVLNVPLHYFLCKDDREAQLACLIAKLPAKEKDLLIKQLASSVSNKSL